MFFYIGFPRKGTLTDAGDGDGRVFVLKSNFKSNRCLDTFLYHMIYIFYICIFCILKCLYIYIVYFVCFASLCIVYILYILYNYIFCIFSILTIIELQIQMMLICWGAFRTAWNYAQTTEHFKTLSSEESASNDNVLQLHCWKLR